MRVSVCLSVCLSVRKHISETTRLNYIKFSVHVAYGCGSILFLWRCDTLCTSGFVDNVTFCYNRPHGGVTLRQRLRSNLCYGLTPLLRGIGCVLSETTALACQGCRVECAFPSALCEVRRSSPNLWITDCCGPIFLDTGTAHLTAVRWTESDL